MDEYRKIQETPAEKRLNGTSAGVFLPGFHVSNMNGNYFLKNIINRLENFFRIIYNNHRNNFQKRRIKEKVI